MRRQSSGAGLEMLDGVLDLALKLSAAVVLLVTGYYIYATLMHSNELFRGVTAAGQPMTPQQFQHHIGNLQLLTKALTIGVVVLVVSALGRFYAFAETGAALVVGGALLFFGMPFMLDTMSGTGALPKHLARMGDPRAFLKSQYLFSGLVLLVPGAVSLFVHAIAWVATAKDRRPRADEEAAKTAATVKKKGDQFLGPCWNLPFCRDTDKKLCPVRASKKPCWRTGRGCYCDQNVILTLSGGNQYAASRGTSGYLSRTASVARPKTLSEKRDQCLGCPVYLHHQGHKYKLLVPLSMLTLVGGIVYYWANIQTLYPQTVKSVGRAFSSFSFGPNTGGVPNWALDLAQNQGMMWLILIVLILLAVTYLLHGVEWVLYRLGI